MESRKIPAVIYAESTPNPSAMKFVANRMLIPDGLTVEYSNSSQAKGSPLALALFNFPFVATVSITGNFISIFKNDTVGWNDIALELREFIRDFLNERNNVITELPKTEVEGEEVMQGSENFTHSEPKNDTDRRIIELLEEYIRPAVESDGGAVYFKSFEEGKVTVNLRGSCSGCPSSTFTLKAGIEGLLKRMLPEIEEVVAEAM